MPQAAMIPSTSQQASGTALSSQRETAGHHAGWVLGTYRTSFRHPQVETRHQRIIAVPDHADQSRAKTAGQRMRMSFRPLQDRCLLGWCRTSCAAGVSEFTARAARSLANSRVSGVIEFLTPHRARTAATSNQNEGTPFPIRVCRVPDEQLLMICIALFAAGVRRRQMPCRLTESHLAWYLARFRRLCA